MPDSINRSLSIILNIKIKSCKFKKIKFGPMDFQIFKVEKKHTFVASILATTLYIIFRLPTATFRRDKMMLRLSISCICILCAMSSLFLVVIDAAMQFTLPKDDKVVCTDSMDNVCTAPTSCNKNGKVALDTGNNYNVGSATQDGGAWLIQGGYTIDFPSLCNVTCQGNCTCTSCIMIEVKDFVTTDKKSPSSSAHSINVVAMWTAMPLLMVVIYNLYF
jgi:hypothetical protein